MKIDYAAIGIVGASAILAVAIFYNALLMMLEWWIV